MALHIIATFLSKTIPSSYYVPLAITTTILVAIRTFSQGRRTTRDRDLHARTVIITVRREPSRTASNLFSASREPLPL